jgi:hypothetical protein
VTRIIPTSSRIRSESPPPVAADEVDAGVDRAGTEGSSARRPDRRCWPVATRFLRAFFCVPGPEMEAGESASAVCDCCWAPWPELPDCDEDGVEPCVTGSYPVAVGTLSTYSFGAELVSDGTVLG